MRAGRSSGSLVGVFGMLSGKVLFLVGLAIGADSFAPSSVANTPRRAAGLRHVSSRAPTTGLSAAKCAMTDEHKKAFDPSARGAVRPGTDVVSLLTKYAWGQQSPGIDLPYPIAPGTPPVENTWQRAWKAAKVDKLLDLVESSTHSAFEDTSLGKK